MNTHDSRKLSDPESPRGNIKKAVGLLDEGSQSNAHLDVHVKHGITFTSSWMAWSGMIYDNTIRTWKLCPTRDAILREASQALEKDLGSTISVEVLTGCCCIIGVR